MPDGKSLAFTAVRDLAPTLPSGDDITVIVFRLDPPADIVAALRPSLSSDEKARADRFHFDRHRRRFIVGRAVLRHLLASATGTPPERVAFDYGEHGKPALRDHEELPFNLSNSSELAAIAVGGDQPLGVDVEKIRPMDDGRAIAERFFSASEVAAFERLAQDDRDTGFFRCWTRKEAYIKAIGDGLTMPLDRFDVALGADEPCRMLLIDGDEQAAKTWSLDHFEPHDGYLGALARNSRRGSVRGVVFDPAHLLLRRWY